MAERTGVERRLTTESKGAKKTTEFMLTVVVILLILISAFMIKGGDSAGDEFVARQAWLYVAIVTGAYAIGRGLAKSGVREYPEDVDDRRDDKK
ncbi:MAG: hypothetical protein H0U16_00650 [Actinobacteria bacterium]|nr:hypothetical protein [Actinomycetota bacterium]